MRDKNYSTGLRGVLFEAAHYRRMGAAVWLYGWLVLRQTHQSGPVGWVLGGAPVTYAEIEEETGFHARTLERWMRTLRRHGYIETEVVPGGMVIRITKAKKFVPRARNLAEGVRRPAGERPQTSVADGRQVPIDPQDADRIGSSFVARSKSKPINFHRDFHSQVQTGLQRNCHPTPNPSGLAENQHQRERVQASAEQHLPTEQQTSFFSEARLRQQLIRAEREEAVRRELAVGSGPEVRRT